MSNVDPIVLRLAKLINKTFHKKGIAAAEGIKFPSRQKAALTHQSTGQPSEVARQTALPLLLLAIPDGSRAQEISKEVPVNAQAKPYGTGWECKRGFRWDGAACIAIKLPENAYLSDTSYQSGWE